MSKRLGSWQKEVLWAVEWSGMVTWSHMSNSLKGKARSYSGKYLQSFASLGNLPGYEVGAFGPRGGLALRKVG